MLGSKFVKFLKSILKRQVSSSSVFVSFFIVMTHNSSVNFEVIHFLLWAKGSHESSNFDTFECSGENLPNSSIYTLLKRSPLKWKSLRLRVLRSKFVKFLMPILKRKVGKSIPFQILYPSSVSWEITPLYLFSSNNI